MDVWGTFQRFEYEELSLELRLSDYVYRAGNGDSYFQKIGYDRFPVQDAQPGMFYGYTGFSHIEGPPYRPPLFFSWDFQWLSPDQYAQLRAIVERSRAAKAPVRLIDSLLKYVEVAPRTRAKIGAVETFYGMDWYFAQFDVWLEPLGGKEVRENGRYYLKLEGREWNPAERVPTTEDLA